MANICENHLYLYTENKENFDYVIEFFKDWQGAITEYSDKYSCDIYFDSKWTFPEKEMEDMAKSIPHPTDIYMRCMSIEFGCYYHALFVLDNETVWREY